MKITNEIIETGRSSRGGWSNKQLAALGVPEVKTTHCNPGWRDKLIGCDVPEENIKAFLSLKDSHLKGKNKHRNVDPKALFDKADVQKHRAEYETNKGGTKEYCCKTCFHYQGQHCDGLSDLSKVCEWWYSPDSPIRGLRYG